MSNQFRGFSASGTMFKSAVFNLQEASKDQVQEFLNSFDTVLTDCDGKIVFVIVQIVWLVKCVFPTWSNREVQKGKWLLYGSNWITNFTKILQ